MENCSDPITNTNCIFHKITGEDEEYWQQANTEEWFP